jgi:hypothetical protein
MNGATADPLLSTINIPINKSININGSNQYFFLTFKNAQISFKNSIIDQFDDIQQPKISAADYTDLTVSTKSVAK